jgi:ribosomal-protein-alanine N-acetyltransferase
VNDNETRAEQEVVVVRLTALAVSELLRIEQEANPVPWSARLFEDEFRYDYSVVWGARSRGRLIGFIVCHFVAQECHILNIAVEINSRRRGVARALLNHLITPLISATDSNPISGEKIESVTLEVREHNSGAQALYKSFGFEELGRRKGYYADSGEDALIMTRSVMEQQIE